MTFTSSSSKYYPFLTLSGIPNGILSVSFSANGQFLAATSMSFMSSILSILSWINFSGYGTIRIWDLSLSPPATVPTPNLTNLPESDKDPKYIFTSSTWLFFQKTNSHLLVFGTLRGDIHFWSSDKDGKVWVLLINRICQIMTRMTVVFRISPFASNSFHWRWSWSGILRRSSEGSPIPPPWTASRCDFRRFYHSLDCVFFL